MTECIAQMPLPWKENILSLKLFSLGRQELLEGGIGGSLTKEQTWDLVPRAVRTGVSRLCSLQVDFALTAVV